MLRSRTSKRDSRVTLVSLAAPSASDESRQGELDDKANMATSASSSPVTRSMRSLRSRKPEPEDETCGTSPQARSAKRPRKVVKKDEGSDEEVKDIKVKKEKPSPSPKKSSPTKLRAKLTDAHPEPPRWKETYEIIRKQREGIVAAVDLMGCDAIAGMKDEVQVISDRDRRLASLISLMLSSQTKDPVTHEATMNLRRNLKGGLCLEGILGATDAEIQQCINKVGFWRRKTEYIRKTAEILRDRFDGDVPKTIEDLLILPGVGPKMGFLCLQAAWGIQEGIGVDTHVHRITNRLGWHKKPTTDPEETRVNLESWLPKELHNHINIMLVGLGQTICLPVNPRCDLCHLGQMEDSPCPSKRKVLVKSAKAQAKKEETPAGEVGPIADSLLEVEETETKPVVEIKMETVEGHLPEAEQASHASPSKTSSYFASNPLARRDGLNW